MTRSTAVAAAAALIVAAPGLAETVRVTVTGTVEYNQIPNPPLGDAGPDDRAEITFTVDSDVFVDSINFPTRGYEIDHASYQVTYGPAVLGLQDPFPGAETPYFVLRDNDPAVDGFFTSTNIDFPFGVPIDHVGNFGQFHDNQSVTYVGDTLESLDILDALGVYGFGGLTVFHWTVDDGGFEPMGMVFGSMTIELESACVGDVDGDGTIGITDLLALLAAWGHCGSCAEDLDGDGVVGITDLLALLAAWGPCQ